MSEPTGGPPRRRLIAMAVIGVLAVAAILVVALRGTSTREANAANPPTSTHPSNTPAAAAPNACGLTDTDQTVPTTPPPGVRWKIYQTVALPFSTAAGPGRIVGDVANCYAHTPTGALIAATQIASRYLIAPDWRTVTAEQVVPGAGRDTYVRKRGAVKDSGNHPGDYGQLAGFRIVTFNSSTAVVQLVTRFPAGLQMTTETVTWSGGDWRMQLQDDGGTSPNVQRVDDLSGFIRWGGV